jgi:hypothetical protein
MTYAPGDLLAVRHWLLTELDLAPGTARGVDLEPGEVGIVGDPAHASSGGYHEGNDDLARVGHLVTDYSKRESPRDRPGTDAAAAMDIGDFAARGQTLRSLTLAVVAACQRNDPRTRDIREVIYTPNGTTVRRWDRLGIRSSGDSSHLWHTHLSFHRDSEGRRDRDDNFLGLLKAIIGGGSTSTTMTTTATATAGDDDMGLNDPHLTETQVSNTERYQQSTIGMLDEVAGVSDTVNSHSVPNLLVKVIKQIAADVADLKARPAATVALSDADRADIAARVLAGIGHVPTAAEDAEEIARRLGNG